MSDASIASDAAHQHVWLALPPAPPVRVALLRASPPAALAAALAGHFRLPPCVALPHCGTVIC